MNVRSCAVIQLAECDNVGIGGSSDMFDNDA